MISSTLSGSPIFVSSLGLQVSRNPVLTFVSMERVEQNVELEWPLFYPKEVPNMREVYGAEFEELYIRYENKGRARKLKKFSMLSLRLKSKLEDL